MPARQLAEEDEELFEQAEYREVSQPTKRRRLPRTRLNTYLRSRCVFLVLLLTVMGMIITLRSSMGATNGYEVVQIQQEAAQLEQENERLKVDIAQLKSPQRIKNIAAQDLGMVVPQQVYFSSDKKE